MKLIKCCVCGRPFPLTYIYSTDTHKNVCKLCTEIARYETPNNLSLRKETRKGTKYGFELEGVCKNHQRNADLIRKQIANVVSLGYKIIPTADGSLPYGGVEFKTPIINSLRGVETMLTKVNQYVDFANVSCGQHINMSNPLFTSRCQEIINDHHKFLDIFAQYLVEHPTETVVVCGRYMGETRYAAIEPDLTYHSSWINLSHWGRAEFRLSKIQSVKQYVRLVHMWEEILFVMTDYAREFENSALHRNLAALDNRYANTCIRIFNRYVQKTLAIAS